MTRVILYIFLLLCQLGISQEIVKTFLLDTYKYDNVITETDDNGNLILCFYYKNRFEIKVLDKNKNITAGRAFKIKEFDKRSYPIGIGYDHVYIYVFFMDFRTNLISRLVFDRDNVMVPRLSANKIALPKHEKYLESVNVKGQFKILLLDERSNEFVVRSNKMAFDSLPAVRIPSHCDKLSSVFLNGENDIFLKRIYTHNDNIQNTNFYSKIYFNEPTVYITIDNKQLTHFFSLDLVSNSCKYNKLNFHLHRCEDEAIKAGNSHIKDERLFRVTYCASILNLSVLDLDSMLLTRNYSITPDKSIDIKTGELISEVKYEDRSDSRDYLRDSEQFLDYLDPEGLGVAVSQLNGQDYLIQIGSSKMSYYTVSNPGYGPNFGMGSGVWVGGGGLGSPSIFNNTSMNTYKKVADVYFKSILNKDNLQKSSNNRIENSIYDKITSYENVKVNTAYKNMSVIIENENEILYGYFNGKDDLYHLVKFNP